MKNYFFLILVIFIYINGNSQVNEAINAQNIYDKTITLKQSEIIFEQVKLLPNKAQVSFAFVKKGNVKFYGIKRINDSILTVNNHKKVFEIGSVTKVFTATLLANFVIDEQIKLEDNINEFFDFNFKDGIDLSFKQLVTHTSGLPRVPELLSSPTLSLENPYKDYGEEELKNYLKNKVVLDTIPGTKSAYSNLGFGLLGHVLSKIESKTFEDLLQEKIFSKYKMNYSTTQRYKINDRLIKGLNDKGELVSQWDMSVHMGAGGILSSVKDLSKFALAQFDSSNEELKLTRTPFFKINDNYTVGLAWGLVKSASGEIWNWHNGGTGGYTSSMILNTNSNNGIIVLSNISALGKLTNNIAGLSPELMKTIDEN